ncbi:MAG: 4Fe-4S binding protein [Deltaproteobacteria bacterium]|nr:4Fe-4S binding protein [Deltaproteobacteria bacterium]
MTLPIVGQGEPYRPNRKTGLRQVRRAVQLLALALWLALFLVTRHQAQAVLPPDLFLFTDPLVALITMAASQVLVPAMAASLVLVVLTLALGRVFCGWLCPLGTLFDLAAKIMRPDPNRLSARSHARMQRWKYLVLVVMVAAALVSAQWVYLLDPLVLLFRGVAAGLYPLVTVALPPALTGEKLKMTYHGVAFLPTTLLVIVLMLTAITPRFYCRYLCPLGALYGLLSRRPWLRRRVDGCDACTVVKTGMQCVDGCRMGAVRKPPYTQNHECIRCFAGRSFCHAEAIHFDWTAPTLTRRDDVLDLGRRRFVVSGALGAGLAPLAVFSAYHRASPKEIIRPPRVLDEETFTAACVRCAMCVQSCPTQTLQLVHLEAGVAGFWTPAITPTVNGCIADCNACSVVCPTAAIPKFGKSEADKWAVKMGTVILEKNRCISYVDNLACGKCLDICPTKAFVIETKTAARPRRPAAVDYERCVGCGLCELACAKIVFGTPALITFSHGRGQPTALASAPTEGYLVPERD